jgi:Fic family protein
MGALELFLHDRPVKTSLLIKAALAHVQFETIHPFLDGNGRLGRLLITLLLCSEGALSEPLLYLSLYFKQHRQAYYDLLQRVRTEGEWEDWLLFFMEGVRETAENAVRTARRVLDLFQRDTEQIQLLGKSAASAFRVHAALQRMPIASATDIARKIGISIPTAIASLTALEKVGIVKEMTGKKWGRLFSYDRYVRILNEGAEPIRPGSGTRL